MPIQSRTVEIGREQEGVDLRVAEAGLFPFLAWCRKERKGRVGLGSRKVLGCKPTNTPPLETRFTGGPKEISAVIHDH